MRLRTRPEFRVAAAAFSGKQAQPSQTSWGAAVKTLLIRFYLELPFRNCS